MQQLAQNQRVTKHVDFEADENAEGNFNRRPRRRVQLRQRTAIAVGTQPAYRLRSNLTLLIDVVPTYRTVTRRQSTVNRDYSDAGTNTSIPSKSQLSIAYRPALSTRSNGSSQQSVISAP